MTATPVQLLEIIVYLRRMARADLTCYDARHWIGSKPDYQTVEIGVEDPSADPRAMTSIVSTDLPDRSQSS